jgi:hypothetical protein
METTASRAATMKLTRLDLAILSPRRKFLRQVAGATACLVSQAALPSALRAEAAGESRHASDDEPVHVGMRKQLFVDDYIVAEMTEVSRELGVVTKANQGRPIMRAAKPW